MFAVLSAPVSSRAQQADAPSYTDGEWWRVKVDVARPRGVSVSGPQFGGFPEFRVEINAGKPTVFGIRGDGTKTPDAPATKAIVSLKEDGPEVAVTSTLVDFNLK